MAITTSLPEIVVSLAAVRMGAVDLGIANVLGSNLFNLLILALDDVFYRRGPVMADAGSSHIVSIVMMNGLFLIGLTYKVMTTFRCSLGYGGHRGGLRHCSGLVVLDDQLSALMLLVEAACHEMTARDRA